ncbi:hypothetical protein [Streptomyces griseorubiginosus]|uniref:hypothetical protein n=1 Tax=Streptomyces griseorubiginosus TaxID=67304 RepID=UPI0033E0E2FF
MTIVGLSSNEGDGAEKAVEAVFDGIAACAGGFGIAAEGEHLEITKVAADRASGAGGRSVAFAVDSDMDGDRRHGHLRRRRGPRRQHRLHVLHGRLRHAGQRKAATVPTAALDAQVAELK